MIDWLWANVSKVSRSLGVAWGNFLTVGVVDTKVSLSLCVVVDSSEDSEWDLKLSGVSPGDSVSRTSGTWLIVPGLSGSITNVCTDNCAVHVSSSVVGGDVKVIIASSSICRAVSDQLLNGPPGHGWSLSWNWGLGYDWCGGGSRSVGG